MHSIDPTDFSHAELAAANDPIDYNQDAGGWTCHVGDGLTATDFTYHDGQLVDVHHSGLEASFDHQDWATSSIDCLETGHVDVASPALEVDNFYTAQESIGSWQGDLSTADFTPQAMPRSGADYGAAAEHEGLANHYDSMAQSWGNSGYLDTAADYQKYADAEREKAAESLDR
jgi:hypothetical protein